MPLWITHLLLWVFWSSLCWVSEQDSWPTLFRLTQVKKEWVPATYTGNICHSGCLWHVTHHGDSGICHRGERRMSRHLYTVANKVKWRPRCHYMHLLYAIKWQMICFQALLRKTKSFDKVCLKFQLPRCTKARSSYSTVAEATMAQNVICHCYPEWHNFPVYHAGKIKQTRLCRKSSIPPTKNYIVESGLNTKEIEMVRHYHRETWALILTSPFLYSYCTLQ